MDTCEREHQTSLKVTEELSKLIHDQQQDLSLFDSNAQLELTRELKREKENNFKIKRDDILSEFSATNQDMHRCITLNQEKGSGSWLSVLPLKDHGYSLNKQEFRDALCLRYGWSVPNMPHISEGVVRKTALTTPSYARKGVMWP